MSVRANEFDWSQVLIEPVQDLAQQIRSGHQIAVAAIVEDVLLVRFPCSESLEKQLLIRVNGKGEVVATVDHQQLRLREQGSRYRDNNGGRKVIIAAGGTGRKRPGANAAEACESAH